MLFDLKDRDDLSTKDKNVGPIVSLVQRFHCIYYVHITVCTIEAGLFSHICLNISRADPVSSMYVYNYIYMPCDSHMTLCNPAQSTFVAFCSDKSFSFLDGL